MEFSEYSMKVYRYILVFVQYVIPFCVISFVYVQMAVKLWGSKTPGNAQNERDKTMLKNKKKVSNKIPKAVLCFYTFKRLLNVPFVCRW